MIFVNSFYMSVYTWWPFAFLCCACLEVWFTLTQDFAFITSIIFLTGKPYDFGYICYCISLAFNNKLIWSIY